jgi:hypothetical protein
MKTTIRVTCIALLLVGCAGAASPSPASSTDDGRPAPSVGVSASPAVESQPVPGTIEWGAPIAIDGRLPLEYPFDAEPGMFVTVANTDVWVSADGVHWDVHSLLKPEFVTLNDVAIGSQGIVAVGEEGIVATDNSTVGYRAVVLLSLDGEVWKRIEDPAFEDGQMRLVGATRQGFVAFGSDFGGDAVIWTSPDGRDWLRATNETGLEVAGGIELLIEGDGRLTAIVGQRASGSTVSSRYDVWQTEGRADWERAGTLTGGGAGRLLGSSGGGRLLVVGWERAWTSADGVQWEVAVHPQGDRPASISDVAAFPGGYVAVGWTGSSPGETCGGNEPWVGHTWTSANGRVWHEDATFQGAAISHLVALDGAIVGLGQSVNQAADVTTVMWTARLPASLGGPQPTPSPTPSPTPAPSSEGCGG